MLVTNAFLFTGEGVDFFPVSEELVFTPNTNGTECFDVRIQDDNLLEDSEIFNVSILVPPNDSAVDIPEPVLQVTIEDDDSM